MNNEDKELLEKVKDLLGLNTYREIAIAIGEKENSVINWSNRGLSKLTKAKISHLINSTKMEQKIEKFSELQKYYELLDENEQEMYLAEIKARALRKLLK